MEVEVLEETIESKSRRYEALGFRTTLSGVSLEKYRGGKLDLFGAVLKGLRPTKETAKDPPRGEELGKTYQLAAEAITKWVSDHNVRKDPKNL